jgi:hypothetical protein
MGKGRRTMEQWTVKKRVLKLLILMNWLRIELNGGICDGGDQQY